MPAPPDRIVEPSSEAYHALLAKVNRLSTSSGTFSLAVTECEITSYLAHATSPSAVKRITVWFESTGAHVATTLSLTGGSARVHATLSASAHDGTAAIELGQATWNGRPIPRFVMASIQEALNDALSDAQLGIAVSDIAFSEGSLTVAGVPQ